MTLAVALAGLPFIMLFVAALPVAWWIVVHWSEQAQSGAEFESEIREAMTSMPEAELTELWDWALDPDEQAHL